MNETDIWRIAGLLIEEYGEEAVSLATKRADAVLAEGDADAFTTWLQIVQAIETLQRKDRGGEVVN